MKRLKSIKIFNLIIILFVVVFSIGYAFAWFLTDAMRSEMEFNGSSASAYFAGGNGSAEHPYQIENRYHMYNLAWLQDTGRFCDADGVPEKLYFELTADFNMVDGTDVLWLPPIGNADYPFVGVFDGNGHQITNLKITTDKSKLNANNDSPLQGRPDYEFANSVGMFGATQSKSSTDKCVIKNFILDNPEVEVSATNTRYSSVTATDPKAAGIAIGYVDGLASSIGVRGGTLTAQANYSTFNSILGVLADGVQSSVTGGGHGGGEGTGDTFGATLDIESLYNRIDTINRNKGSGAPSHWLPDIDEDTNDGLVLAKHEKLPFTVTSASTYTGVNAKEVYADNNVGYLCGNQNKVYQMGTTDHTYGAPMARSGDGTYTHTDKVIPRWLYWMTAENVAGSVYSESFGTRALTAAEFSALPENIQNFVNALSDDNPLETVKMSQTYNNVTQVYSGSESNGQWSPHGEISWMGKTYGEGFASVSNAGNAHKYPVVDGKNRYLSADGYKVDIYGTPDSDHNYDGYLYEVIDEENDIRRYLPPAGFTSPIASIDADGYAKAPNGYYYNNGDGYVDANGYRVSESGKYYININGSTIEVDGCDADGYAMNSDGLYYDVNGFLIDADGYAMNSDGYMVNNNWPIDYASIEATTGLIKGNGGDYNYDKDGDPIKAFGYSVDADHNLMFKDGPKAGTYLMMDLGWNPEYKLTARQAGNKVRVIRGMKIHPQTGKTVQYYRYNNGVVLPNCGIWFKPATAGKIRIIMYSNKSGDGFALIKCTRNDVDLTDRDSNGRLTDPFKVDYSKDGTTITGTEIGKYTLPSYVLYYFEFDVTPEDIAAGNVEYWLMQYGNKGAYFVYLDLGASSEGDQDVSTVDPEKHVSAVDFIYTGVEIKTEKHEGETVDIGNFIIGSNTPYLATKTSLYFEQLTGAIIIEFSRPSNGSDSSGHTITATVTRSSGTDELGSTVSSYSLITYS